MAPSGKMVSYLFTSALADAIFPVFYIFLPLFAAELGADPLEIGLVGGATYGVYSFMPFVMGYFSDRRGSRKFFVVTSLVLLAAVSFLYSTAANAVTIIVVRVFEGIGWAMLWPAMEAAITEDTPRDSRSSLAIFNYTWSAGAALGPALGTFLVTTLSYRSAFLVGGILFVFPLVTNGLAFLRERGRQGAPESGGRAKAGPTLSASVRGVFLSSDRNRDFQVWVSFITMALSTLTSAVFFTFFGPYAVTFGISVVVIGAVTSMVGVVRFVVYVSLARRSLREGALRSETRNRNLIFFTCLATLSSLLLLVRDPGATLYFLAFGLFGFGFSMVYSISQTTMIADIPARARGAGAGLFESSIGLGGTVGPVVAGAMSSGSLTTAFVVPVVGLALTLILVYVLSRINRGRSPAQP